MNCHEELTAAAAAVRAQAVADAEYLDADGRAASEALAVLLERSAKIWDTIPAGMVQALLDFARALLVLADDGEVAA